MITLLLCLLQLPQLPSAAALEGRGAPTFTIPRIEADPSIDGRLDEPAWTQAARLAGFSQYQPVDGRPAEEQTEVLVFYTPSALYFAIIAHDSDPGSIRATVADRDNLGNEDTVTIFLDTFNDRRRAFFFGVNPLGAQEDGVQTEGAFNAGSAWGGGNFQGGTLDKSPDYKWDSAGMITEQGYIVEIRIPFKSLRYPGNGPQRWGINIQRKVQRTGYVDTWTDVRRASNSFLGQSGAMEGLHDLKRGVVTEAQPFITATKDGARTPDGNFQREKIKLNPGVNLRLGFTNMSIDATVNPDFSQVESDAGQVTVNQRFALFYPEKRPFFLEGIELFSTPNQLVYTRQVEDPITGAKFTGKFGRFGIAYLNAVDDIPEGGHAVFNITRLRADLGANSLAGVTYTDRIATGDSNRVVAADARITFKKLYYVQGQLGRSWSDLAGGNTSSPLWSAEFDRTGRAWGFNYKLNGIGESFEARSGYVPRNNIVEGHAFNRFTWYGERGAVLESFSTHFGAQRIWNYRDFLSTASIEGNESVSSQAQLRGGWDVNAEFQRQFVRFDPSKYTDYQVQRSGGTVEAFAAPEILSGAYGANFSVSTPTFRTFGGRFEIGHGKSPIFDEAANGRETVASLIANLRPTDTVRVETQGTISYLKRARDGSEFARTIIPRVKIEYQPRRSLFFRVIGEYRSQRQAALEDPRTGDPLIVKGVPSTPERFNGLRLDLLVSYEPTPGTVAFFGYGSSLDTDRTFGITDLRRTSDGFFLKLAYQFRR
ncbi:MAG: carbohydrate binding family 9 domain-containing protein [Acidobacteriia bacterium]|nr:carbohydrate binding family 9 domain-containing protein [Terriglobia bacterium]